MEETELTTSEAAERLGVTPMRVRQLCQGGELPGARRRGRDWLIPVAAISVYQQNRRPAGYPAGRPRRVEGN